MRVMILGAGGMLGHDLVSTAPQHCEIIALTQEQLDITHGEAVEQRIREVEPDTVINAAAYTAVDSAENDPSRAYQVNADAVGLIGRAAGRIGTTVVHFSSDYVFDGNATRAYTEDDPPRPINVYGASKLAGELALVASGSQHLLLRTSWLFGENGRSFPRTMWERALAQRPTRVVNDQYGRPTYSLDLATTTWQLLQRNERGVLHVANTGHTTWFDIGAIVFRRAGVPNLLSSCSSGDYPTAAARPRFSVLDTTRVESVLGKSLSTWQSALERFLHVLEMQPKPC